MTVGEGGGWMGRRAGLSLRGRNANRKDPSWGRSVLHDQDMGKTQDNRSITE